MSIAEFPGQGRGNANPELQFERTPPQDLVAEQGVLGGMLLSKDAIADVVEIIKERDFYRPAHELIYDAILDLYGRGEPADPVTVASELTKRGDIARAGGAPYLHTLISSVPTAANASYYARIVRDHAIMRRLVEAGTKIVQLGYSKEGDVDDVVDSAQAEIYSVTEHRTSEDYIQLSELLPQALDEIEAISSGVSGEGVKSGFKDLDNLIELTATQVDKEGSIVTCEDEMGRDFFFKIKTPWYCERHGLLTEDLYREHIIIGYILDDKIDDILGQVPEDEKEAHERINKIISIVKRAISDKVSEIETAYSQFVKSGMTKKDYAIKNRVGNPNFGFVMNMVKADDLRKMSKEEILDNYDNMEDYETGVSKEDRHMINKIREKEMEKIQDYYRKILLQNPKRIMDESGKIMEIYE